MLSFLPAAFQLRRHSRIGPERMAASRRPARIDHRLLANHQVWVARQFAAARLTCETDQILHAVAGVNDGGLACLRRRPRHRSRKGPVHLESAPAISEAPNAATHPGRYVVFS